MHLSRALLPRLDSRHPHAASRQRTRTAGPPRSRELSSRARASSPRVPRQPTTNRGVKTTDPWHARRASREARIEPLDTRKRNCQPSFLGRSARASASMISAEGALGDPTEMVMPLSSLARRCLCSVSLEAWATPKSERTPPTPGVSERQRWAPEVSSRHPTGDCKGEMLVPPAALLLPLKPWRPQRPSAQDHR